MLRNATALLVTVGVTLAAGTASADGARYYRSGYGRPHKRVVVPVRVERVVRRPGYWIGGGGLAVSLYPTYPPPAARIEYVRPRAGYAFIPGRYDWRNGAYVWCAGHWVADTGRSWVPGRWDLQAGRYVWIEGSWGNGYTQPYQYQQPYGYNQSYDYQQPYDDNQSYDYQQPYDDNQSYDYQQPYDDNQSYDYQQPYDYQTQSYNYPTYAPPTPQVEVAQYRPGYIWVRGDYEWRNGRYVWCAGRLEPIRHGWKWRHGGWRHHGRYWVHDHTGWYR